ncbi:MAG: hypothetical protein QM831_42585 [Kofleriaceae bacterium]
MDAQLQADVEKALRGGNPDDAARVIMTAKNISLDEARKEVGKILSARNKR